MRLCSKIGKDQNDKKKNGKICRVCGGFGADGKLVMMRLLLLPVFAISKLLAGFVGVVKDSAILPTLQPEQHVLI